MLCLRCSRGVGSLSIPSITSRAVRISPLGVSAPRTFTSLAPRRPTIFPSLFRTSFESSPSAVSTSAAGEVPVDLLPKISAHPALASTQVRCGPRNTFNPSHFVRKRRHGFLSRLRTRKGRATLQRRRSKARSTLSH